jgi:hypothetical protein
MTRPCAIEVEPDEFACLEAVMKSETLQMQAVNTAVMRLRALARALAWELQPMDRLALGGSPALRGRARDGGGGGRGALATPYVVDMRPRDEEAGNGR